MAGVIIEPLEPKAENKRAIERAVALLRRPAMGFWRLRHTHLTWSGTEKIPRNEAFFVLANHSNMLDPAMLTAAYERPVHFLAADSVMEEPFAGRVCRYFGAVPKKKFSTDSGAIRRLRAWAKLGASVGLFPEGERSWDGELLPFVPGIERMIRLLGIPIVVARIHNAYRVWPRWAPRSRRGRVHIEFEAPIQFERREAEEKIGAYLRSRIHPNPAECVDWPVHGRNLAVGLDNPLFACPQCNCMGSLVVQGDTVHCRQCSAGWTIDTHNYLHGMQNTPDCSVSEALAKINHRLLERGGTFAEYDGRNDQLRLECDGVTWIERARGRSRVLGNGKLQLHTDRLEFHGGQMDIIPIHELTTASVDLQRRLVFRTAERTLEARVERGSVVAWERVTNILRRAAINN